MDYLEKIFLAGMKELAKELMFIALAVVYGYRD